MKLSKLGCIGSALVVVYFVSHFLVGLYFPNYQFLLYKNNDSFVLATTENGGTIYNPQKMEDNYYFSILSGYYPDSFFLQLSAEKNIQKVKVEKNNMDIDAKIINISKFTLENSGYDPYTVIEVENKSILYKLPYEVALSLLLALLGYFSLRNIPFKSFKYIFVYSPSVFKHLKRKDLILISLFLLITTFTVVGVDGRSLFNALNLNAHGVNLYQFQVCKRVITNFEFPEFPYNPNMLLFWSPVTFLWGKITLSAPIIKGYPFVQIFIIKFLNYIFGILTTLSIFSFLLDQKIISNKYIRPIMYLSILNPVFYYIAILFVQIDTFAMYLMTLGILLLMKAKQNLYVSVFLITFALLTKMQMFLFYPIVVFLIILTIIKNYESWAQRITSLLKVILFHVIYIACFFAVFYQPKQDLRLLLSAFKQTDRIWFTNIQYISNLYLLFSFSLPILVLIINYIFVTSKLNQLQLILNALFMIGCINLMFNFSILSTPSFVLHSYPALILLLCLNKDYITRIFITLFSGLIVFFYCISDFGDISRVVTFWRREPIITTKLAALPELTNSRLMSGAFSISLAAQFGFGVIFLYMALKIMKSVEYNDQIT